MFFLTNWIKGKYLKPEGKLGSLEDKFKTIHRVLVFGFLGLFIVITFLLMGGVNELKNVSNKSIPNVQYLNQVLSKYTILSEKIRLSVFIQNKQTLEETHITYDELIDALQKLSSEHRDIGKDIENYYNKSYLMSRDLIQPVDLFDNLKNKNKSGISSEKLSKIAEIVASSEAISKKIQKRIAREVSLLENATKEINKDSAHSILLFVIGGFAVSLFLIFTSKRLIRDITSNLKAISKSLSSMSAEDIDDIGFTGEMVFEEPYFSEIKDVMDGYSNLVDIQKENAIKDRLTGLPNFAYFEEIMEKLMEGAKRSGIGLSLVIFDIDYFKKLNDEYGHINGNIALKAVSNVIMECCRSTDAACRTEPKIVNKQKKIINNKIQDNTACRYGGEEFVLVLQSCDIEGARVTAERIRRKIEVMIINLSGKNVKITISGGCAQYDGDSAMPVFIEQADAALYSAKHNGRNKILTFEPDMLEKKHKDIGKQ